MIAGGMRPHIWPKAAKLAPVLPARGPAGSHAASVCRLVFWEAKH